MAALDKTYCKTWEEYQEVVKWCKENTFTCPNGVIIHPIYSIYKWEKENFTGDHELPILNTSQTTDYFLIKYCPIKLVQDRMREVYDDEYVKSIKNGTSEYDTFVRPESGTKVKMIKDSKYHNRKPFSIRSRKGTRISRLLVDVEYNGMTVWYNEDIDNFVLPYELGYWTSSATDIKCKSIKAVVRRIRKWKLPKGSIVTVLGGYVGEDWKFKVI